MPSRRPTKPGLPGACCGERPRRTDLLTTIILVAGDRRIHGQRPRIDPAHEVVHILEPLMRAVFSRRLASNAVMALEDQRRVAVEAEDVVAVALIQQPEARDSCGLLFPLGADV